MDDPARILGPALRILFAIVSAGCWSSGEVTARELRPADVEGRWTSDQGGTVRFLDDGTFEAEELLG